MIRPVDEHAWQVSRRAQPSKEQVDLVARLLSQRRVLYAALLDATTYLQGEELDRANAALRKARGEE